MNNLKSKAGFTLVELIVVIAILAILAGVAVPAYNGYITKANDAADITKCDAIKTAVFATYTQAGEAMPTAITVADGSVKIGNAEIANVSGGVQYKTNFESFYGATVANVDLKNASATWSSNTGTWTLTPAT